jgi:hypothetical protein
MREAARRLAAVFFSRTDLSPSDPRTIVCSLFSLYRIPVKITFAPVSIRVIDSIFPWKKYG